MAITRVRVTTPPLLAAYGAVPPTFWYEWTEAMLTIAPPPEALMWGMAYFEQRKTPRRLTAMQRSHSSVEVSSTVLYTPMPALLTRTWRVLNRSTVSSTIRWIASSLATSHSMKIGPAPSLFSSAAALVPSDRLTSAMTTLAPSRRKTAAVPFPIPIAPPVTMATLFSSFMSSLLRVPGRS